VVTIVMGFTRVDDAADPSALCTLLNHRLNRTERTR
jgi:hypothetical protein